jgi:hypothetical protein
VKSVRKELVRATALGALEVVLNNVSWPFRFEQVLQGASRVDHQEGSIVHNIHELRGNVEVLPWFFDIEAFPEVLAFWAGRHTLSLSRSLGGRCIRRCNPPPALKTPARPV